VQKVKRINVKHMVEVKDVMNRDAQKVLKEKIINVSHMVEVRDVMNLDA
jgi:hypothetical protein